MKVVIAAFLTGVLWSGPAFAQDFGGIPDWIEDLGQDDIETRTKAGARLLHAGRAAWGPLTNAESHSNPEISARATQILSHARLRRQISYRILRFHPNALYTLKDGPTREKLRLIATFGRYYKESRRFLLTFSADPNPRIAVAAAEALYDNRDFSWVEHLLRIYAEETVPRSPQISRLLVAASSRIPRILLQNLLGEARMDGKARLISLADIADNPLTVSPSLLRRMTREGSPFVQTVALRWIRNNPLPGGISYTEPLLDSSDAGVVTEGLITFRILRHPVPVDTVLLLSSHEKAAVRQEALRLLYFLDKSSAATVAREKLGDPSTSVRKVALQHLWKMKGKTILPTILRIYLEEGSEQGDLAATFLIQNWDWAESRLRGALKSVSPAVRHRALRLLYRIGGNRVLDGAMDDPDEGIRLWALRRVLSRNHPSTVSTLEKLARDTSSNIRFEAIRGLVRSGQRKRLDDLHPFLESGDYLHQVEAAETLFDYSRERVLSLAIRILKGTDPYLKRMALDALCSRQVFEAIDPALPCLHDRDPRLRRSAARYLSQALAHRPSAKVIAFLRNSLPGLKGERFNLTFQLLTAHGDETCRVVILDALRSGKGTNHYNTLRALCSWSGATEREDLLDLLGDDPILNQGIFRQIGSCGREHLDRAMDGLLSHRNPSVRSGAIPAALDLAPDVLRKHLPALLRDGDPGVRFEAIVACRKREEGKATNLLLPLLDDEDPELRLAAAENLLQVAPRTRAQIREILGMEECPWVRRRLRALLRKSGP